MDLFLDQEIATAMAVPSPIPLPTTVLLTVGLCAKTAFVQKKKIKNKNKGLVIFVIWWVHFLI